jgi:hypothetical protein
MCQQLLSMDIREVKKNINRQVDLPYVDHLIVLIPAIIPLTIIATFLIYLSKDVLLEFIELMLLLIFNSTEVRINLGSPGLIWRSIALLTLTLGLMLLFNVMRGIRFHSIAEKRFNKLLNEGKPVQGCVQSITNFAHGYKLTYTFTLNGQQISKEYIAYRVLPFTAGDSIELCIYSKTLSIPIVPVSLQSSCS